MPDLPEDFESLRCWLPVIRHIRSVAKQGASLGVVTLRIVVDEYGKPAGLWVTPTFDKLIPRSTADQALRDILDALLIR